MKINKSPIVSNGVRASAFDISTVNFAQSLTWAPKQNHGASSLENQTGNFGKSVTLLILEFFLMVLFLSKINKSKLVVYIYKNNVSANWENYKVS